MIIKEIILNNFRQFYGEQKLELSLYDPVKNVSVIYGANGRGKTGLYRALMFCLYGDKRLAQDSTDKEYEINLVNKLALDENSRKKVNEVEAFVEVKFTHDDEVFCLKRTVLGIKKGDEEVEQIGEAMMTITDKRGNSYVETDSDKIASKVNSILDNRLKEFFLFDGEKIERLTRTNREQKREIEIGIKNLLGIDKLSVASKGIEVLLREYERQLKNQSTGEYQQLLINHENRTKQKENLEKEQHTIEDNIELADGELDNVGKKLKKFEGISQLLKARERSQNEKNAALETRNQVLSEMVVINSDVGLLLIENEIKNVDAIVSKKMEQDKIPSQIRESLVNKILSSKECICGTNIEGNKEALKRILEWKNKIIEKQIEDGILDTFREALAIKEFLKHKVNEVQVSLQRYAVENETINKSEDTLARISNEIGDQKIDDDIPKLEKSYQDIIKKRAKLEQKLESLLKDIGIIKEEILIIEKNIKELEKKEGIKNLLVKKMTILRDVKDAMDEIFNDFTAEIKVKIGTYATEIFQKLIDNEGGKTFKEIKISDDYTLQLLDWRGKTFLSNVSAGQRQVISISLITALARIAGGKDVLEIPLFMDTPFGRLSGEHRDRLIENVPNLAKQWILLATDTEFGKDEAKVLKLSGRWGRIYCLEGEKPFQTFIREKSVDTFIPTRTNSRERNN